ncbi:MAG: Hsp20/alpha crystallin family protein [Burkholderiales bacterium]|nr:Hsp20/alpha crystallin family protein [Burkholderiales bacterium]
MYESLLTYPGNVLAEFDRLQRGMEHAFGTLGLPSSIRAVAQGAFPGINIGTTPASIEVYAFAPGLDPAKIEVSVDRGVLTISGERAGEAPGAERKRSVYASERYFGPFRRALSLSEDADPAKVQASYRDGVLHISVGKRDSAQPRRIEIK